MPFEATYTEDRLREAVKHSQYLTETLRYLGLTDGSGKSLKKKIEKLNISTTHWKDPYTLLVSNLKNIQPKSLEEILVENSNYTYTTQLKERLLKTNLLENKCYKCGQLPIWCGEKLNLQLDHINGVYNDNRLSNLRILCPNCHTQTETFYGKKDKRKDLPKCLSCDNQVRDRRSKRCKTCYFSLEKRK
jgi:hypothetical protein